MRSLSRAEAAIIEYLARGFSSKEMAAAMDLSVSTVEFYVRTLYVKFDARTRAAVVGRAYEEGHLRVGGLLTTHAT